jgi:hypothetical protein
VIGAASITSVATSGGSGRSGMVLFSWTSHPLADGIRASDEIVRGPAMGEGCMTTVLVPNLGGAPM